ncbi:MAG: peptide-methionine (S)-S-oxide reductase, partial [Planctomyces sp.]
MRVRRSWVPAQRLGHTSWFPQGLRSKGAVMISSDETAGKQAETKTATATFAAGCFWCTEAVFLRVKGVTK